MPPRYAPLGLLTALLLGLPARAQQFATDTPGITAAGACAAEAWADARERWLDLTCTPVRGLELALDSGFAPEDGRARHLLAAAFRAALAEREPGRLGLALDGSVDFEDDAPGGPFRAAATTLVLLSAYDLPSEGAALFGNVGWTRALTGNRLNELVYGARVELPLAERFVAVGEAYGEGYGVGYHGALRWRAIPDRLVAAVGFGGPIRGAAPRKGLTLGLAWSPPAFFQSLR